MSSTIQEFYANKTVLITGSTGFLGSYLVEKLLRCLDLKKIFVLIRPKSKKSSQDRLNTVLDNMVYTNLKEKNPNVFKKLYILAGDLELPGLGLSDQDLKLIINEVNCIFHVGATVRFTEELRRAILINIYGTDSLVAISKEILNLKCFVHISTAFSQILETETDEISYISKENSDTLINMAKTIDNEKLKKMTPIILDKWPNTYVFTKHVAEDVIRQKGKNLPITIVRPSIISPPYDEPGLHWTNSVDSITFIYMCINLGIFHTFYCNPKHVFDLVPADFVINHMIAAGWMIGTKWETNKLPLQVFNYVSSTQNPITWGRQEELFHKYDVAMPSIKKVYHRLIIYSTNRILEIALNLLFSPWIYLLCLKHSLCGETSPLLQLFKKGKTVQRIVKPFISKEWRFKNHNTQLLWNSLKAEDKELFNFDIKSIDWEKFHYRMVFGARLYVLKDSSAYKDAQTRAFMLAIIHYIYVLIYVLLIIYIFYKCAVIIS